MFIGKQQRRGTDMMTLHSLMRFAYDTWRFQRGTDVSVICDRIVHHYFAGGLHRVQEKPVLREAISEAAIASNRTNITRWFSKTHQKRALLWLISALLFRCNAT
ncbi:hypothetical protein PCI56_13690 [Plesiomonas shigelloides subsp. oncorhynchi]|nr:hypothetical protein [Plesiomonas shigelloides]